ncbi:MAG: pyridoxine 5'-phosphate synthase [Pseudomonadota bacterium]
MKPIFLGVNVDHVATIRQARGTRYPDPVTAAAIAEQAGADGITIHLREDKRHIQERDVRILKETLTTRMNLEMAVTDSMLKFAESIQPEFCCLVPEKREELTTEGGLDVFTHEKQIKDAVEKLSEYDTCVSLFVDADSRQLEACAKTGATYVEIHTGHYAHAKTIKKRHIEYQKILEAVKIADQLGLSVNAGHGLTIDNVGPIAAIPEVVELNIGHAIIAKAIFIGLETAVKEMKEVMQSSRLLNDWHWD